MNSLEKFEKINLALRIARYELDLNRFEAQIIGLCWKQAQIEAQKRREYQV